MAASAENDAAEYHSRMMTQITAFDTLAPTYDADFSASPVAAHLRAQVRTRLLWHFPPGSRVLELGCGTGDDAAWLAERGVHVLATDASAGMLAQAQARLAPYPHAACARLDLDQLTSAGIGGIFDGVYANFGVLNCLTAWRPLAAWLADRIRPGGTAAFSIMSPLCIWETVWCALHGDFGTAFRRWRTYSTFQPADAAPPVYVRYPTIAALTDAFAPHFRRVSVTGVGIALPPTAMYPVVERRPGVLRMLTALDAGLSRWPQLALLADHYWIEFERR